MGKNDRQKASAVCAAKVTGKRRKSGLCRGVCLVGAVRRDASDVEHFSGSFYWRDRRTAHQHQRETTRRRYRASEHDLVATPAKQLYKFQQGWGAGRGYGGGEPVVSGSRRSEFSEKPLRQGHRLNAAELHTSSCRGVGGPTSMRRSRAAAAGAISDTSRVKSLC